MHTDRYQLGHLPLLFRFGCVMFVVAGRYLHPHVDRVVVRMLVRSLLVAVPGPATLLVGKNAALRGLGSAMTTALGVFTPIWSG